MRERYIMHKLLLLILIIAACFLTHCLQRDTWFDDGTSYLCPECKYKGVFYAIGECVLCHCETPTVSYKYCYDCAKALDCCQMCGVQR